MYASSVLKSASSAGATIGRTRRLPSAPGERGRQNYNCVLQKVTNAHQNKGNKVMKVNETHDHAVYEKINVLHYFRFAVEGLIFFLLISVSHILNKLRRNLL